MLVLEIAGLSINKISVHQKAKLLKHPIRENVFASPGTLPRQLGLDSYIDYNTQFDKSFVEPIKTILDAIGWQVEKRANLDSFWS